MPGESASADTFPKKSFTPTCPAGTVRRGPPNRSNSSATPKITVSNTRLTRVRDVEKLEKSAGMAKPPISLSARADGGDSVDAAVDQERWINLCRRRRPCARGRDGSAGSHDRH